MFTQNHFIPTGLLPDQRRAEYPMACNLKGAWYKECGHVMILDCLRDSPSGINWPDSRLAETRKRPV